jgi:hypothetical protein
MQLAADAPSMQARPWWPEIVICWCCLMIAIGMGTIDLSGHLCCDSPPKLLPRYWAISQYEFGILISGALLVVIAMIVDLRRFEFDGHTLSISRLFVPRAHVEIAMTDITSVSSAPSGKNPARMRSYHHFVFRRVGGRVIKVPARYLGAMHLAAAVQAQLDSHPG